MVRTILPRRTEMINAKEELVKRWGLKLITSSDLEGEIKEYFKMTGQSVNKMNYVKTFP